MGIHRLPFAAFYLTAALYSTAALYIADGFYRAAAYRFLAFLLLAAHLVPATSLHAAETQPPGLLLANVYNGQVNLDNYWVSEKLDGVRAYWDGSQFLSRQGNVFHAPEWFTAGLPPTPLDGELWMGRGRFEAVAGAVRQQTPDDRLWRQIRYMVFDLPTHAGTFDERLLQLGTLIGALNSPHIQLVEQFKVPDSASLKRRLQQVVKLGGEGLMLHKASSLYRAARSDDLLKLKTHEDAEAVVIAHLPGKGKYTGMLGAVLVETPDKLRFKIGTGFKDKDRANPPPIGSTITYKYFGKTRNGIPKFASFLRVREL